MPTPAGIFWDIQNIDIPRRSTSDDVVSLINTEIINKYDLVIRDFYVAGAYNTIKPETVNRLALLDATFEEAEPGKNVADNMIKRRMSKFIDRFKRKCTIILISGDNGFRTLLKKFQYNDLFKAYFVRLEYSFGDKLTAIADRIFILKPNSLELFYVKPRMSDYIPEAAVYDHDFEFRKKYFVKIRCYYGPFAPEMICDLKNSLSSYGGSFVMVTKDGDVWCSFDEISNARSIIGLAGIYYYNSLRYEINAFIGKPTQEVINSMDYVESRSPKCFEMIFASLVMVILSVVLLGMLRKNYF